ncbi:hypothetical protein BO71DRAFT_403066 [Aspergillus ellipticus CBS 707.79]|uniref:Uncharacterized protein n=1 Tax=Aspergillus ellipticus CBS 707.79 TaxID=1448320 RepID=A0A319CX44_9EURO|nr:hypothetical protein BO71DRAFT_403066 [Aspergillus ellipticus CBS 707.79]
MKPSPCSLLLASLNIHPKQDPSTPDHAHASPLPMPIIIPPDPFWRRRVQSVLSHGIPQPQHPLCPQYPRS